MGVLRVIRPILMVLALASAPLMAAPAVTLASDVFVERSGDSSRIIQPAEMVRHGDRVVTIVTWKRTGQSGQSTGFTVTNPLPRTLQFQGSADGSEQVSADGGRTWGRLGELRVGGHVAAPEEVTHVRWRVMNPAPKGRIAYAAIVR